MKHTLANKDLVGMEADCKYCGRVKIYRAGKDKKGETRWRCNTKVREKSKKYVAYKRNKKYGKVVDSVECQICGKTEIDNKRSLDIDHCHTTGKIRGRLCSSCNLGLGSFKDNIDFLNRAVAYLIYNSQSVN